MTGADLVRRRTAAGLTLEKLAEILGRHDDEVKGWEASGRPLPKSLVRELEWVIAGAERDQAFERAGLPPCPWVQAREREFDSAKPKQFEALMDAVEAHAVTCDVCRRRESFAATLPPPPPVPLAPHVRALVALGEAIRRLPEWLRPAAVGALLVGVLTVVRALIMILVRQAPPTLETLAMIGAAIGAGAYGGAIGGFAYQLAREPTRRVGALRPYALGLACAYAFLIAFGLPAAIFMDDDLLRSWFGWIAMAVTATIMGVIIGHMWFKDPEVFGDEAERRGSA